MKKKKPSKKVSQLPWDRVRVLPLKMYQTVNGPTMGRVEKETARGVRIWAPAQLIMPNPANVFYLPIAFCERYLDLFWSGIRGTNEVPAIIAQGYEGYFEKFSTGSYSMEPVGIAVGIDGRAHEISTAETPSIAQSLASNNIATPLEVCPGCHAEVSNWQAHYPVLEPANGVPPRWVCEITEPNVREKYPNYEPVRPLST